MLRVEIAGDWLDRSSLPAISCVEGALSRDRVKALEFDATALGRWDSALMVRILSLHDLCTTAGIEFRAHTLPGGLAKLTALSQAVPEHTAAVRQPATRSFLERIGESGVGAWAGGAAMLSFLGESVLAFWKLLRGQAQFRWSDTLLVIQQCGPEALGIVALINFLMGMILAFVGATELGRFGASVYTANLVAVATVREMACIMTGIIICGRTGAAFAAQLGTMKVNQEIEAFQTFGIAPFEFLVLPRMLALIVMMPLLCLFADFEQFDVDASGRGVLIAQWRILSPGGEKVLEAVRSRLSREGPSPGTGASGAVATLSGLLADLSSQVAQALREATSDQAVLRQHE